jgi:very-short-patch-repair endonuclease
MGRASPLWRTFRAVLLEKRWARENTRHGSCAGGGLGPAHPPRPKEVSMHKGNRFNPPPTVHRSRELNQRARAMRRVPTSSEALLFQALRGGRLGVSVRRQVPLLGRFIADLFVPQVRLVIEVDGGYHTRRPEPDARRDRALVRAGYHVLRVEAELVIGDLPGAVESILDAIAILSQ